MSKLTVKALESLRPINDGTTIRDEGNLLGKVRAKVIADQYVVSVSFYYRYKRAGKSSDLSCGTWPKVSLQEIRARRDEAKHLLAKGLDPVASRKTEKLKAKADQAEAIAVEQNRLGVLATQQARKTVRDLFEHWAKVELMRRKDGGKEIRRMFQKDVLPILGDIAVEDVKKGHIGLVVDGLLARGVQRMAKMIFSLVRQMFRFAQDRDIIENDPTAAIRKAKIGGKDTERDRVLSEDEIRDLQSKLPSARLTQSTELAIWICLSTCCRIGELLRAKWQDVDFDNNTWRIPPENSKNGKSHVIYLSDFAYAQFRSLFTLTGTVEADDDSKKVAEWCYPDRTGTAGVCTKTITKQLGDRQRLTEPMSRRSGAVSALVLSGGNWTPHDLRRTGATLMTALGVLPEVAERCLNHTEQDRIKRIYQRHSYETEKREAWKKLGTKLETILAAADNVIHGDFRKGNTIR